ncbi:uncharacterized protein [Argopecten irradians]|uniref:uncharacterized protein n=1 Tax=Argopecten irradians TaxID=31199 RepID=UPI0037108D2A
MEEQYMRRSVSMDSLMSDSDNELWNLYMCFYLKRIATRDKILNPMPDNQRKSGNINTTVLDTAMVKLRKEMAAVVDNDIALSKQLLVLHETIESLITDDHCDSCGSDSTCQLTKLCDSCSINQSVSGNSNKNVNVSELVKCCTKDLSDADGHSPVQQIKMRNLSGHQKQNSNDSGFCCVFQDLEVTI